MQLYEIAEAYLALDALEPSDDLRTYLDAVEDEFIDKLENITYVIKQYEADSKMLRDEEKRLAGKRKTLENKIAYLKEYAFDNMNAIGMKKAKAGTFNLNIQKNPKSVNIIDDSLIIDDYLRVTKSLDKQKIKEDLSNGLEVAGAELIQTEGLRIR